METTFGHLHPLLVHLPIGVLLMAFLFELLSRFKGYRRLRFAVKPSLFLGAVAAVVAALTGYWLSQEGGYDDRLLMIHRNLGIGTALLAILVYVHRKYSIIQDKSNRKLVRLLFFIVLTAAVTATGHYGGSLTHGEDYLFSPANSNEKTADISPVANPKEAMVYTDVVKPILEQKCYGCHSAKKQKGQLRMDTREWLEKGGKHGVIFVSGRTEESEIFKRITLSAEMEHHMPPRERTQLTSLEIDVISSWIEEGASFEQRVQDLKDPGNVVEFLKTRASGPGIQEMPVTEVGQADEKTLKALRTSGVMVLPVSTGSNYLMISFSGKKEATSQDATLIKSIAGNVVDLNLTGCRISPEMMDAISQMPELRKLTLRKSTCSDTDLSRIRNMKNLAMLNLASTGITDRGIESLQNAALKKVFLYQTRVTRSGVEELSRMLPNARIDTGNYSLPRLVSDTLQYRKPR